MRLRTGSFICYVVPTVVPVFCIGSTLQPLGKRLADHKQNAGNPSRLKWHGSSRLYQKMREVGVHRWKIVPLITIPCDRAAICECEQEWIKVLNAILNTISSVNEDVDEREYRRYTVKKIKKKKVTIVSCVTLHVKIITN